MELRWTDAAADDLERIADFLFDEIPEYAPVVISQIYEFPQQLLQFPLRGRTGRKKGTRELVMPRLPYIIVYKVSGDVIHLARILHGSQRYP